MVVPAFPLSEVLLPQQRLLELMPVVLHSYWCILLWQCSQLVTSLTLLFFYFSSYHVCCIRFSEGNMDWLIIILVNIVVFLVIALCGSEDQKQKYLPSLSQLNTVACWVRFPSSAIHFFGCLLESLWTVFLILFVWHRHWLSLTMEVMQVVYKQLLQRFYLPFFSVQFPFFFQVEYFIWPCLGCWRLDIGRSEALDRE